ncbi:MAG: VWA domain-containing protein [Acidobacteriota bacterium]|nr:VWA domain-containing protein [Acidobacteriota bacterium]
MKVYLEWMIAATLALFSFAPGSAQDGASEVVKVDVSLVTVNVTVTDTKGHPLSGLNAEDFLVTDEGKPVSLEFFDSRGPASIVFVVDTSSSMKGAKWKNLRAGLRKFLSTAHEGNDYTLIAFNETSKLAARSVSADELWKTFNGLNPDGSTAVYDAMMLGLNVLGGLSQRHKALVLFSDGQDNSSRAKLADVEQEALHSRATIYTVGILPHPHDLLPFERDGVNFLSKLAATTGGLESLPVPAEICDVLERINADVSSQYSLSYYPPDKTPGWRRIEVNISRDTRRHNLRYQQRYLIR